MPDDAIGGKEDKSPTRKGTSPNSLRVTGLCESVQDSAKRRARDSNPQPVSRHLISSQAANHSLTLRTRSERSSHVEVRHYSEIRDLKHKLELTNDNLSVAKTNDKHH